MTIEFNDGHEQDVRFVWISAPINAGFFGHDLPRNRQVKARGPRAVIARAENGAILPRGPTLPLRHSGAAPRLPSGDGLAGRQRPQQAARATDRAARPSNRPRCHRRGRRQRRGALRLDAARAAAPAAASGSSRGLRLLANRHAVRRHLRPRLRHLWPLRGQGRCPFPRSRPARWLRDPGLVRAPLARQARLAQRG